MVDDTTGVLGLGAVNEAGDSLEFTTPVMVSSQNVRCITDVSFDKDGKMVASGATLQDVISSLIEYQKQGVYIDLADKPENYIQVQIDE